MHAEFVIFWLTVRQRCSAVGPGHLAIFQVHGGTLHVCMAWLVALRPAELRSALPGAPGGSLGISHVALWHVFPSRPLGAGHPPGVSFLLLVVISLLFNTAEPSERKDAS